MTPTQARDLAAALFELQRDGGGPVPGGGDAIETVTKIGDNRLVVTSTDGTRAVAVIAVHQTQNGGQE